MTTPPTEQQLDEIETRAAHLYEYALLDDEPMQADADRLTGTDVPALLAALRRALDRVAELERPAADSDSLPAWLYQRFMSDGVGWDNLDADDRAYWEHQARAVRRAVSRGGFKAVAPDAASAPSGVPSGASQPSGVSESAQSPMGAPQGAPRASDPTAPPRRTLTPNEYDAAWHAVEGAAGDEGADPGTVLHAVLDRLDIEWQDAAQPTAIEEQQ